MTLHWQTEHNKLAARELAKIIKKFEEQNKSSKSLQPVPENILEFISKMKPMSEGNLRNLDITPFWKEIYQDPHPFKMILGGRQIYKSTYITDVLTHEALTRPGAQLAYVTFSLKNLASFSRQKLQGSFLQNPGLQKYLWKTSNIDEQSFRNGSRIYCTISINNYKNLEGKSLHHVILDESQEQPMHMAQKVIQTMVATKGKLTICGIGGESGSAYENFWNNSTQFEWIYDEPEWPKKLQHDEYGLVFGRYLEDLMTGKWVANNPNNTICHGYHIPQTM
ncbi:MAG: phage terminase large subunit family protein, partial [Patescibacteria group bacterium]|nr:phage terminase large subunit family protein [Patescibacteria group bacterium]